VWHGIVDIDPARALRWLKLRNSYSSIYSSGRGDDLRSVIRERQDRLIAIKDHFLETIVLDKDRWLRLARFRESTFFEIKPAELLDRLMLQIERVQTRSEHERFFYEAAFSMSFAANATPTESVREAICTPRGSGRPSFGAR
jgi:hypothetical protein